MGQKASKGTSEDWNKNGGLFGIFANFLGLKEQYDNTKSSANALLGLPELIMKYLKWVAIGGAVLVGIFVIIFIWRFSRGNAPDVIGAATSIAKLTPQGRMLSMIS
jgi:uncharacterized membrane protein